jgi:hypothetical protein
MKQLKNQRSIINTLPFQKVKVVKLTSALICSLLMVVSFPGKILGLNFTHGLIFHVFFPKKIFANFHFFLK